MSLADFYSLFFSDLGLKDEDEDTWDWVVDRRTEDTDGSVC